MKTIYDMETDTLNIIFREESIAESDEIKEEIIVDYNKEGKIISLEILDASEHIIEPLNFVYEFKKPPKGLVAK